MFDGIEGGLGAVGGTQLGQDGAHMPLDGALRMTWGCRVAASCTASAPLRYDNPNRRDLRYLLQGFGLYENDRTARFFGIRANSGEQDETNYSLLPSTS